LCWFLISLVELPITVQISHFETHNKSYFLFIKLPTSVGSIKTSQIKLKYLVFNNNFLEIFPASMTARLKAVKKSSINLIVVVVSITFRCVIITKRKIFILKYHDWSFLLNISSFYLTTKLTNFVFRSFITPRFKLVHYLTRSE
jgi:hypothetical protein